MMMMDSSLIEMYICREERSDSIYMRLCEEDEWIADVLCTYIDILLVVIAQAGYYGSIFRHRTLTYIYSSFHFCMTHYILLYTYIIER